MAIMDASLSHGKVLAYLVYFFLDLSFFLFAFAAKFDALFFFLSLILGGKGTIRAMVEKYLNETCGPPDGGDA